MALVGADRTAALMLRWAGGRAAVGVVDSQPQAAPPARVTFRPSRVSRLLGEDIPVAEQRALLERVEIGTEPASAGAAVPVIVGEAPVGLDAAQAAEAWVAIVPPHRRDLAIEADIAEEVARVRGYETVGRPPARHCHAGLSRRRSPNGRRHPRHARGRRPRRRSSRTVSSVRTTTPAWAGRRTTRTPSALPTRSRSTTRSCAGRCCPATCASSWTTSGSATRTSTPSRSAACTRGRRDDRQNAR